MLTYYHRLWRILIMSNTKFLIILQLFLFYKSPTSWSLLEAVLGVVLTKSVSFKVSIYAIVSRTSIQEKTRCYFLLNKIKKLFLASNGALNCKVIQAEMKRGWILVQPLLFFLISYCCLPIASRIYLLLL